MPSKTRRNMLRNPFRAPFRSTIAQFSEYLHVPLRLKKGVFTGAQDSLLALLDSV